MRSIPAAFVAGFLPELFQFLEERTRWTRVEDVLAGSVVVEEGVVDVRQQPVGGELDTVLVSGSRKSLFTKKKTRLRMGNGNIDVGKPVNLRPMF